MKIKVAHYQTVTFAIFFGLAGLAFLINQAALEEIRVDRDRATKQLREVNRLLNSCTNAGASILALLQKEGFSNALISVVGERDQELWGGNLDFAGTLHLENWQIVPGLVPRDRLKPEERLQ